MLTMIRHGGLMLVCCAAVAVASEPRAAFHAPLTVAANGGEPMAAPWWVEPSPLQLPSDDDLQTIAVRGRTYEVHRVPRALTRPADAGPRVIAVAADAAVSQADPQQQAGGWGRNPVRGGTASWRLLLRFDAAEWPADDARITLILPVHALEAGEAAIRLSAHAIAHAWDEADVTWATQPALGAVVATGDVPARGAIELDITGHVRKTRGPIALAIVSDSARQVTLQGRELHRGAGPQLRFHTQASLDAEANAPEPGQAIAHYDDANESLYFRGSGRGGRESRERLIIEDCTFIMDFQEGDFGRWDARRSAIYVEGFAEVIVRNCTFVSRGRRDDPPRKTNASLTVYDSVRVQIEDCTFQGKTNWMRGHITVFCCGPTTIRGVNIVGTREEDPQGNEVFTSGGGIWVANGLGEGKIGTLHDDDPDLMIYPSGPLLIEDCTIRNQTGRDNTDAIYVQSIHPFLIRNCRVENWRTDALLDLGFRDTLGKTHRGEPLTNHGAMGVVERCHLAGGFVKVSVGAGGGIVMRDNTFDDVWLMPYAFDGGNWFVKNNRFVNVTGPLVSGRDSRTSGWAPSEGMFLRGSKLVWRNNTIEASDTPPATLFVPNPNGPSDYDPLDTDVDLRTFPPAPQPAAETALESLPQSLRRGGGLEVTPN
jgi:hypothetical protein